MTKEGARFALEKINIDLRRGGLGLLESASLGLVQGISAGDENLMILSKEKAFSLAEDLVAGQRKVHLENIEGLKQGRQICIFDSNKGEANLVISVQGESLLLSSPLDFPYQKEETSLFLLEKISYFFDEENRVIRRKVNSSPSQPLLEDVTSFDSSYDKSTNLARVSITLKNSKETKYETSVFPKNMALKAFR